jgi:hypothetical protein
MNACLRLLGGPAVLALSLGMAATAQAQTYDFSITTSQDTASGQFTLGNPMEPNTVTSVTGMVDGNPITGLSDYGFADQHLSTTSPYVDRSGIAFTDGTLGFNIFDNYTAADGSPVYSLCNSAFNGGCVGGDANAAPVATFTLTAAGSGAVPEPATWAMIIAGMGMIGGGLRLRRRQPVLRYLPA